MESLQYYAPASLAEATQLLAEHKGSQVLAGGTDLLVQMRLGMKSPPALVDIKNISDIQQCGFTDSGELVIGAAVPCAQITESVAIAAKYPGLVEAAGLIGSTQIQGRCSIGGNLCNASPAADTVPALIANHAVCEIQGVNGSRQVPVSEFNLAPGQNCLAEGEFLVALRIPALSGRDSAGRVVGCSDAYLRFIPRTEMDIAVVGAAVSLTVDLDGQCTQACVAIGAVAPTALIVPEASQALVGTQLNESALISAGQAATRASKPINDKRGTAEYRKKVVAVLVRRAAVIAYQRALETFSD